MHGDDPESLPNGETTRNPNPPLCRSEQLVRAVLLKVQEQPRAFRTCADMANEARMSSSHFTRTFKSVVKMEPQEYLRDKRLEEALQLLKDPQLSIKEIASECGFKNQNHFSTWFKKHCNVPPSVFRAQNERE